MDKGIERQANWSVALFHYINWCQSLGIRLDWETHHCFTFGLGAVHAMTGVDLWGPHSDKELDSPKKIYRYMQDTLKTDSIIDLLDRYFDRGDTAYIQRGDLLLTSPSGHSASDLQGDSFGMDDTKGMPLCLSVAEPPFYWVLTTERLERLPIIPSHPDLIRYKVGSV